MPSLQEIRQQYPQYSDIPDQQLADKFYQKYYSDLPRDQFDQKMGFSPSVASAPISANQKAIDALKAASGMNTPGIGANFLGGILHGAQSMLQSAPDLSKMVPASMMQALPYQSGQRPIDNFDAYKFMGTSDQPFYTRAGAEQLAGELFAPGKAVQKGAQLAIPEVKAAANKLMEHFSPERQVQNVLNGLSGGVNDVNQVRRSLIDDIRNSHDARNNEASVYLNHVKERAGDEKIFDKPDPLITTQMDQSKRLIDSMDDLNIGDLYSKFKGNPTFNNAHDLQSELGVLIGDLSKNPYKTINDARQIEKVKSIRDALKSNMMDFLNKRDMSSNETLAPMYKKGSDLYRDNVVPYLSSKKLREITRGRKTAVKNVHGIFDTPYNIVNKFTGQEEVGPVNKIMQDLPDGSRNKILFSRIGGNAGDANKLLNKLDAARSSGYEEHFSPELKQNMDMLRQKLGARNMLMKIGIGGGILGGAGTAYSGFKHAMDAVNRISVPSQAQY